MCVCVCVCVCAYTGFGIQQLTRHCLISIDLPTHSLPGQPPCLGIKRAWGGGGGVLTLHRSIPLNGNISCIASRSPSERWASIRMQYIHYQRVCANTYTCTNLNLKQINPPQWEHIKHRQLIPIGEVGIYKNATHTSSEGVCENTTELGTHHASPVIPIGEVGIYKNAIHMGVCANTYMCTDTHVCTCAALLHLQQKKAAPISPSTENRREASRA